MVAFIGLVRYGDAQAVAGERELEIARGARAATELNGGRFLSIFWTEGGADGADDVRMALTFEGRDAGQATRVFRAIADGYGVHIRVLRALSEGEKERTVQRR